MNPGDTVQIEAPDFDPDIDGLASPSTDEKPNELRIQQTSPPTTEVTEPEDDSLTPVTTIQQLTSHETDKQTGWMQSQFKSHGSHHQQFSQKSKKLSEAKPDITPKVSKFRTWRTILKKSSLQI